jgi:hypothetical protein
MKKATKKPIKKRVKREADVREAMIIDAFYHLKEIDELLVNLLTDVRKCRDDLLGIE